jgi:hypothetical protein
MKQNLLFGFFLFLSLQSCFSQTLLKGKVISEAFSLDNIAIINLTTKASAETIKEGYFSILAKPNDTLLFSGMQIKGIQVVLKAVDFSENLFFVKLKPQINQLEEVNVYKNFDFDPVKMRILSKPAKKYTPAERRIYEATSGSGIVPLNPILNAISGRTTMLKKELVVEKEERLLYRLAAMFEDDFYTDNLKIPADYIKGFQYYVINDPKLIIQIKAKNKAMVAFVLGELSEKFKNDFFPEKK